jgi:DNA modification methylase
MPRQYHKNPRQITTKQMTMLAHDLAELGDLSGIVHDLNTDELIGGNQRSKIFRLDECEIQLSEQYDTPDEQGTVALGYVIWQGKKYTYRQVRWDTKTAEKANIVANKAGGTWDFDILGNEWEIDELLEWGFEPFELGLDDTEAEEPAEDPGAQVDRAEELREKWDVHPGQLWQLGEHRLICGDCTDADVVARLMGGEKAVLCHADPPYGMGKENDGIANDNLYRENLDAFQMQWWKACRPSIEDNGSAYIWGNAEDLWRLWYVGGLKDSERLTFRNCIAWDKYNGNVKPTQIKMMRSYVVYREDCFFFMLGEQGFNNNADNYWNGWEGIRSTLAADCEKMGWTGEDIKRITGVGMYSHWFTKSQWTFIPEEHYKKLQAAAREHDAFKREHDAFKREHDELKREHDELKREFYETRAYFDNTHDNMTDVWSFGRVQGEDRHGHATPKPVEMMARAIKSSSPDGAIVYAPFNGTGPELIACEQLGRKCRAVELSAAYCAVAIQRWVDMTGQTPELVEEKAPTIAGAGK